MKKITSILFIIIFSFTTNLFAEIKKSKEFLKVKKC